jgi:hypothetical protein
MIPYQCRLPNPSKLWRRKPKDSIHVDSLCWKQPEQDQTREASAEYRRSQDRLEEIRSELAQLSST